MTEAEEIELGTHLVGLAVLVDQTYKNKSQDGKYNPVASTMGAETTVGSRYVPMLLGAEPRPVISPKVEQKGMKVVDAYNELFTSVPEGEGLLLPTSLSTILDKTDELDMLKIVGRCVRVGEDLRDKRVVYHWAITMDMDSVRVGGLRAVETYPLCLKTVEFRRPDVVTSEEFRADQDKYVTK